MKLSITSVALALAAGLTAPGASAADFWLQGRYSAWMVKRSCLAHGGQFDIRGGLRYRCELADGKVVDCTENQVCRAHDPSASALPPSPRTVQGFLSAAATPQQKPPQQ